MLSLLDEALIGGLFGVLAMILVLRRLKVTDAEHGHHVLLIGLSWVPLFDLLCLLGSSGRIRLPVLLVDGRLQSLIAFHGLPVSSRAPLLLLESDHLFTTQGLGHGMWSILIVRRVTPILAAFHPSVMIVLLFSALGA